MFSRYPILLVPLAIGIVIACLVVTAGMGATPEERQVVGEVSSNIMTLLPCGAFIALALFIGSLLAGRTTEVSTDQSLYIEDDSGFSDYKEKPIDENHVAVKAGGRYFIFGRDERNGKMYAQEFNRKKEAISQRVYPAQNAGAFGQTPFHNLGHYIKDKVKNNKPLR